MSCSSHLEMSRLGLGKLAGSPSDHGAGDAPNSTGDIEHARTRPSEGNPGCSGFGPEAWPRGRTTGPNGPADRTASDSVPGIWCGWTDVAQTWSSGEPAIGRGTGSASADDHSRALRRFWTDTGLREALGVPRHSVGQGHFPQADDGRRSAAPPRQPPPRLDQIATSGGAWRNRRVIQHRYTSPSANHTTPSTSAAFSRLTSSQISDTAPITGKTSPPNTPILRSP